MMTIIASVRGSRLCLNRRIEDGGGLNCGASYYQLCKVNQGVQIIQCITNLPLLCFNENPSTDYLPVWA